MFYDESNLGTLFDCIASAHRIYCLLILALGLGLRGCETIRLWVRKVHHVYSN
jgi:hypothetical protein